MQPRCSRGAAEVQPATLASWAGVRLAAPRTGAGGYWVTRAGAVTGLGASVSRPGCDWVAGGLWGPIQYQHLAHVYALQKHTLPQGSEFTRYLI